MIFPIAKLLSHDESVQWIEQYFHPQGFGCPTCKVGTNEARRFRVSRRGLVDYRCKRCDRVYNLYTGSVFSGSTLSPQEVVLVLRGVCKGESTASLAEELERSRQTIHTLRQKLQANGYAALRIQALPDAETETDEMFQNAGEKRRRPHRPGRPAAPPCEQTTRARHVRK